MGKLIDLTGQKFGRLTVMKRADDKIYKDGTHRSQWICKCCCGNTSDVIVLDKLLKNGKTQSCGCLKSESVAQFNKTTKSKRNKYDIIGDIVVMYTSKGEQFFIDKEDLPKVRDLCWYIDAGGYVVSTSTTLKDGIKLHRLITDAPDNMLVDHIGGSEWLFDNRKCNLRLVTSSQNQMNRKLSSHNTSGYHGVTWDKQCGKWRASITINKVYISLGLFDNIDECVEARKKAEKEYFGEFAYDYSQQIHLTSLDLFKGQA